MRNGLAAVMVFVVLLCPLAAQDVESLLRETIAMVDRGDVAGAIRRLEAQHEKTPLAGPAMALLGALYLETNRAQDAHVLLRSVTKESTDPALLYQAGRAALMVGEEDRGEALLARSAELSPLSPAARTLGLRKGRRGETFEAYRLLRPWAMQHPSDAEVRLPAAFFAVELRRAAEAEELLSELPQDDPRVRLLWGRVLLQKGDPKAALAMVERGSGETLAPELSRDLKAIQAEAHSMLGEPSETVRLLEGIEAVDVRLALLIGAARAATGDPAGAERILRRFAEEALAKPAGAWPLEQSSVAARIAFEYGRLLVQSGKTAKAVPFLERAVEIDPWLREAWEALARAREARKETSKAKAAAKEAKALESESVSGAARRFNLQSQAGDSTASVLLEVQRWLLRGNAARALDIVRREAQLVPADLRPRFLEFQALLLMGRFEEADRAADRTLEMAPANGDATYQKGVVSAARGKLADAERHLRRALELAPDHTAAMNDLAMLLVEQKRAGEARQLLERALILQPDDPDLKANLEKAKRKP